MALSGVSVRPLAGADARLTPRRLCGMRTRVTGMAERGERSDGGGGGDDTPGREERDDALEGLEGYETSGETDPPGYVVFDPEDLLAWVWCTEYVTPPDADRSGEGEDGRGE